MEGEERWGSTGDWEERFERKEMRPQGKAHSGAETERHVDIKGKGVEHKCFKSGRVQVGTPAHKAKRDRPAKHAMKQTAGKALAWL